MEPSAPLPYAPVPHGAGIFLESLSTPLLVLHALAATVLIGSTTHDAILLVGYLRGRFGRVRLEKLYVRIQLVAYLVTFALGSLAYPAYRIYVRAAVFDRHAPWAANLFDIKENLAALALPLMIGYAWLSRVIDPRADAAWRPMYVGFGLSIAAVVWFSVVSGLVVVLERAP
ncbi:MAG: hypothetical protein IPK07_21120 [Deltaproteobacteria bacterium]|nr:hypothetical protein [Deltaproteobacteria bacterium]